MQWGVSLRVCGQIHQCPPLQEQLAEFQVATLGCYMQWRHALRILAVDVKIFTHWGPQLCDK